MGHTIHDCPLPASKQVNEREWKRLIDSCPTLDALKKFAVVILSGPEHIFPWLDELYGRYEWEHLEVPRAGLYHESMFREDGNRDFDRFRRYSDWHFFPAAQDADFFDQEHFGTKGRCVWMPFGVDTEIFCPVGFKPSAEQYAELKVYSCAFIGLLYPKRVAYLQKLAGVLDTEFTVGQVQVVDLSGVCHEETALRYAAELRRIKVFVLLPSLSQLLVSKVQEVLACGTFLLCPLLESERELVRRNMNTFENGRHLIYYRPSNLRGLADLMKEWSSEEKAEEREKIAWAGCELIHREHSMERKLETVLATMGVTR